MARTETALAELMDADLTPLDIVAVMIDGVHFAGHCCVVALGIGIDGTKHPLGVVEGDTENATVVKDLLAGLRDRGLDVTRPTLVVIDGAKALARGGARRVRPPGGATLPAAQDPQRRSATAQGPGCDCGQEDAGRLPRPTLVAEATLEALARSLDKAHPGAAGSLREGLAETLTISRLGVPPTLARTLRSTNAIESMIEICRDHSANVKRWRDGHMALRWCAAGMGEAARQFRRVNGHLHLGSRSAEPSTLRSPALSHPPAKMTRKQPEHHRAATQVPRNSGHPRVLE